MSFVFGLSVLVCACQSQPLPDGCDQTVLEKLLEDINDYQEDHMAASLDGFQVRILGIAYLM